MKELLCILLCLLTSIQKANAQSKKFSDIEVRYYMKHIPDSLVREKYFEAEMVLILNNNQSYYFNPAMVVFYENLDKAVSTYSNVQEIARNPISLPKIRHSAWRENENIFITSPLGKYNYTYKASKIKWTLLSEVKNIGNYNCRLATVTIDGDTIYAWYTTQIPFDEGPFKFKGLPGLILEVYNKSGTMEIEATNVAMKNVPIVRMNEALQVSLKDRSEFMSARDKYHRYPFDNNFPKEIVDRKINELKKINVFLD